MKSTLFAITLTALSFLYWPAAANAQQSKVAKGTITAIAGNSVTVEVAGTPMTFSADKKTHIETRGAGTKAKEAKASGQPGPTMSDVLRVGQAVSVTYEDMDGKAHASLIRGIASVGSSANPDSGMRSTGTVKTIAGDSITIEGSVGGGGSFTQTFVVSPTTKVIGKGVGTAAASTGGRAPFTTLIATGDKVSVSYRKAGNALEASDVRLMAKGSH